MSSFWLQCRLKSPCFQKLLRNPWIKGAFLPWLSEVACVNSVNPPNQAPACNDPRQMQWISFACRQEQAHMISHGRQEQKHHCSRKDRGEPAFNSTGRRSRLDIRSLRPGPWSGRALSEPCFCQELVCWGLAIHTICERIASPERCWMLRQRIIPSPTRRIATKVGWVKQMGATHKLTECQIPTRTSYARNIKHLHRGTYPSLWGLTSVL